MLSVSICVQACFGVPLQTKAQLTSCPERTCTEQLSCFSCQILRRGHAASGLPPSPAEIARLSWVISPLLLLPLRGCFGGAVSHSQLSLQPCGFWLLSSQMIGYMVTDAHNFLKCPAAGWEWRWLRISWYVCQCITFLTYICFCCPLPFFNIPPWSLKLTHIV